LIAMAAAFPFDIRIVPRLLRTVAAIVVMAMITLTSPVIAEPSVGASHGPEVTKASGSSDKSAMHCHEHGQQSVGLPHTSHTTHTTHPRHSCCGSFDCSCPLVVAVVDLRTRAAASPTSHHLLIPVAARSSIPLGLPSRLFRPPIA